VADATHLLYNVQGPASNNAIARVRYLLQTDQLRHTGNQDALFISVRCWYAAATWNDSSRNNTGDNAMPTQPEFGALVKLHESTYDWRNHLDGEAIHNDDMLDWWNGTGWQRVRYESADRANTFLVLDDNTTRELDRASMWFRWPNRR